MKHSGLKHRAEEKQESREQDVRDLRAGVKSAEDLRRENGRIVLPKAVMRLDLAKRIS